MMKLSGKSRKTAYRIGSSIRQGFDIGPKEPITVIELARYYRKTVEELEKRMEEIP